MRTDSGAVDQAPGDELASERAPRRRRLLAGLVAVVLVALAATAWFWLHPSQSFPGGYGMKVERKVGQTVWNTLVHTGTPGAEEVTITGLEPEFRRDGAAATVEYLICELDPAVLAEEGVVGFGAGLRSRAVDRYCTSTRPAVGATFRLRSQPPEEVLVGVTPTRPGRTAIARHHMSFDVGWQRGSDEIDVDVVVVARR